MRSYRALLSILLFFLAYPAAPADYWVDQQHEAASDANPGTKEQPWLTIGKAAKAVRAGDTVTVRPGIYRERVSLKTSGAPGKPITFRAEGRGVVISGASRLAGWQRCTADTAKGNPHFQHIWRVDVDWAPPALYANGERLTKAREPNTGWWVAEGGGTHTLVDAKHLAGPASQWPGGTVFFWDVSVTAQGRRLITSYDSAARTLTLAKPIYRDRVVEPGKDRYYVENTLALLDQPGEWVVDTAAKPHRIYLWPSEGSDPNELLVEAPKQSRFLFGYGNQAHVRIHGFEVRHGASHGIGSWSRTSKDITIEQCYVHHNEGNGLYLRHIDGVVARGNLVTANRNGVTCSTVTNALIEANEIADNAFDGLVVSHSSSNVTIRRNYIHGHTLWGHPDNLQFHNDVRDVRVEDNVLINAGQSIMMEKLENLILRGNVIAGSAAVALIFGHRNTNHCEVSGNTIAFTGYSCMSFTGSHYKLWNNVIYPGSGAGVFGVADMATFESDYNLLFKPNGLGGSFASPGRTWPATFEQYRAIAKQDAHSVCADPRFINAPTYSVHIDERRLFECTRERLMVRGKTAAWQVGDHVEVKFDRVPRTIKEVGKGYLVIAPPLPRPLDKAGPVLNWRDKTDFALDLRVAPDSPARGSGRNGADMGANLDIQAFARGDVDGDGKVDIRRAN